MFQNKHEKRKSEVSSLTVHSYSFKTSVLAFYFFKNTASFFLQVIFEDQLYSFGVNSCVTLQKGEEGPF